MRKHGSIAVQMFDPSTLSFPIRDDVRPTESGQGYALRMAHENRLIGLQQVKRWLGKSQYAALDSVDAELLHQFFGADVTQLRLALGNVATGKREPEFEYAGQKMGRSYFLNRIHPRVCPACLDELGFCKTAWDFALTVVCARHKRLMVDRCAYCLKAMSWSRPAPAICSCGNRIDCPGATESISDAELQFASWVDYQIDLALLARPDAIEAPLGLTPLMGLLWPLTLNGGFHIVYALGTAAGYECEKGGSKLRPRDAMVKARQMLNMAANIAEKISKLEPVHFRISRPSVVVNLLADSASARSTKEDRSLAHSILLMALNQRSSRWTGTHPQLAQLTLF